MEPETGLGGRVRADAWTVSLRGQHDLATRMSVRQVCPDVWTLSLRGDHDLATARELGEVLAALLRFRTRVVLDLSDATFIDSTVIHTILDGVARAEVDEGTRLLIVAKPDSAPQRVIDLVQLARAVPVYPGLDAALADLGVKQPAPTG
jgi:anti-anti-sigma factor